MISSPENNCLFIGDLGRFCTQDEICQIFSVYGTIIEVKIKNGKQDGESLGYGFVTMLNHEEAVIAMDNLNGLVLNGRPMRVCWSVHKAETIVMEFKSSENDTKITINSVYFRYKTLHVSIHFYFQLFE